MRNVLATLALILTFLVTGLAPSQAASPSTSLPACQNEDASIGTNLDGSTIYEDCTWNADTRGNGVGHSFEVINGQTYYTECMAGYILTANATCDPATFYIAEEPVTTTTITPTPEAPVMATPDLDTVHAWDLFESYGAQLLPAEGGKVTLIGANDTGFPNLSADLIAVWDLNGNHYLFQIG